jgi:ankyrin repeat protein
MFFGTLVYAAGAKHRGYADVIALLLAAGPNLNLRTSTDGTALDLAVKYGKTEAAELLGTAGSYCRGCPVP